MNPMLIASLADALKSYRAATAHTTDSEAREDYSRLAAIVDKVVAAMEVDDIVQVKLGVLGFSRQVSDAFSRQPPEFTLLAEKIASVKRLLS